MNKKSFLCMLLIACFLMCGVPFDAYAAERATPTLFDPDTEIENALNGVSDIPITKSMLDGVSAKISDKNGNVVEDVHVDMTIRKVASARSVADTMYVATYVARSNKTDSGTTTRDNVVATVTVTWTDVLGMKNQLVNVSGGWTVEDDTLSGRKVEYGSRSLNGEAYAETEKIYSNSFIISPEDIVGYTLYAKSTATIDSTGNAITLYVESKITT